MANAQKYKDDFFLFTEAGFIAANQSDEDAARKLFKAAEVLNPTNSLPKVGEGYLQFLKLELKQAAKTFEGVLSKEPENEMAKAFLGLTFAFTPSDVARGEKMLEELAKKAKDAQVKTLATDALEFIEKFLKRGAAPTPPPKKK